MNSLSDHRGGVWLVSAQSADGMVVTRIPPGRLQAALRAAGSPANSTTFFENLIAGTTGTTAP